MRLLVLGGTRFLGRAIVDDALSRGYDVTTFSRGLSGRPRPGAEALTGDRTRPGDLRQLAGREWDAVIDTSVIAPADVGASARLLAGRAGHVTYVSSISVYRDWPGQAVTEDSPVHDCPPDATGTAETIPYGALKAGSERALAEAFPGHALLVRPGLILGPHENVGRLPWWLGRFARGGPAAGPGSPDQPVRFTDARDLAAWLLDCARRQITGAVNVPGAPGRTLGELLAECERVTAADRAAPLEVRWVPDAALLAAGAEPWMELPMWAPATPDLASVWEASGDRADRTGMRYRSLADTVHDTWHWLRRTASEQGSRPWELTWSRSVGIDPGKEQRILSSLDASPVSPPGRIPAGGQ